MKKHGQITRRLAAILLALALILSACQDIPAPEASPQPTPTEAPAATTAAPTGEPPATQEQTEPPATEPVEPTSPTAGLTETPESLEIDPDNAENLQRVGVVEEMGAEEFVWVVGDQALAIATASEVALYTLDPVTKVSSIPAQTPRFLTASGDRVRLAWVSQDQAIHIWDLPLAGEVITITTEADSITSLAFGPTGERLAASTFTNQMALWDAGTGELLQSWELPVFLTNLSFSPDGDLLAGVDPQTFTVHIFDLNTNQEVRTLAWTEHASPVLYQATFSPDWGTLAWVARGTIQLMDVESGEFGHSMQHEDFVSSAAWSPDGSLLASSAGTTVEGNFTPAIHLWDAQTGELVNLLAMDEIPISLSFSPNGQVLGALTSAGQVELWAVVP